MLFAKNVQTIHLRIYKTSLLTVLVMSLTLLMSAMSVYLHCHRK